MVDVAMTGVSGHVGGNLVRELLAQGRTVRALVRKDRRAVEGLPIELVEGDVRDPESLKKLCHGVDTVFHCAALISIIGDEGGLVTTTNIQGPKNMVQACLETGVKRLVHFSSIHAFDSNPNDQVVDELRALALSTKHMPYDRSKANGQLAVLAGVKQGLNAVIVNPGAVLGPHDYKPSRMGSVLLDLYHYDLPALIDGGYNWVDARDIVSGALAAEAKGRTGESYLLTGHWAHVRELAELVTNLTGRKTPRLATPLWLAHLASYGALAWGKMRGQTPKFTPGAVRAVRMHRHISHQKATDELGYQPRPLKDTISDTLDWFRQAGMLRN